MTASCSPAGPASTAELAARIKDLTARLGRQDTNPAQARAKNTELTAEPDAAPREIAGLRTALRQRTRQQNTAH